MGAGAVVAAAAAARAKRVQHIIDAFRLADATAPSRASSLTEVNAEHNAEFDALVGEGVVVAGQRAGTWYLSEAGYVRYRETRSRVSRRAVAMVLALAMALLGVALFLSLSHS